MKKKLKNLLMKEESLASETSYYMQSGVVNVGKEGMTITTSNGTTANNIMYYDEAGQSPSLQFTNPSGTSGPTNIQWSGMFIAPTPPEGIGAAGEVFTDKNGYKWVYSLDGEWLQVNKVEGFAEFNDIEIVKHKKRELKCF